MLKPKFIGQIVLLFGLSLLTAWADDDDETIKLTARYEIEKGTRTGRLVVECEIIDGSHIYSLQQASPPGPTKIKIAESKFFQSKGEFTANREPKVTEHDPVFETRLEEFMEKVAFTRPIEVTSEADLEKLKIELTVSGQVCSDNDCEMFRDKKVDVSFGGYYDPKEEESAKKRQAAKKLPVPNKK